MKSISLVFQVHQPVQFRQYRFFDIGNDHSYTDVNATAASIQKLASQCYLPANSFMLRQIERMKGNFRIAFYISGVAIRLFSEYAPEVLESFKKLAETGCVEFLSGTCSYSLASLTHLEAFREEIVRHRQAISVITGNSSSVFFNTGLIYSDEIGAGLSELGFKGVITEGAKHLLGWKSPDVVYAGSVTPGLKILLRNGKLSDDLAFRFSDPKWQEYPLTPGKFLNWIKPAAKEEEVVTIALEYETFTNNRPHIRDFFSFLDHFIFLSGQSHGIRFCTPSEVTGEFYPDSLFAAPNPVSWSGEERNTSIWTANELQQEALSNLYNLYPVFRNCSDADLINDWNFLQNSDHFSYMFTGEFSDPCHCLPNPYHSPFDAFINYMNILNDFRLRLD
jgi:alpha-amylase